MTADDLDGFLEQMWLKFAHVAHQRVADIEAHTAALGAGLRDERLRAEAQSAAHKLIGALGSYRRPGSKEAAVVEQLILQSAPYERLEPAVRSLRGLVGPGPSA